MPIATSQYPSIFDLSSLNGLNGFTLIGDNLDDEIGYSVALAGDVNGDGLSDFLIGAPQAYFAAGQCYVVFGTFSNVTNNFIAILNGINTNDHSSYSLSSAGDINGDGLSDIIIGAPNANNNTGQTYIVFGYPGTWNKMMSLATLNGRNGFMVNGIRAGDASGTSVSSTGDINGDGISDFMIGAPNANNFAGQTYVIFGHSGSWDAIINLDSLDGNNGFLMNGIRAGDASGMSVSTAGDINGDGLSDLVIGAPQANSQAGQSYFIFGRSNLWNNIMNFSILNGTNGFIADGIASYDLCGASVAAAGDVNGDLISDVIISSPYANKGYTQSYVIFGHHDLWNAKINLTSLNGNNGFILNGIQNVASTVSVASAGDINGDGFSDLIIGTPYANHGAGQSYLVFGHYSPWNRTISLTELNGLTGTIFNGIYGSSLGVGDESGSSVSSVGDINDDGVDDIIIGAPLAYNNAGQIYVVFGSQYFSLNKNQLNIINGGFVILNSTYLSIEPTMPSVVFYVSQIQHGQFELISSPGIAITEFTQLQLDTAQVVFYHDGSNLMPGYSIKCVNHLMQIEPEIADIVFIPNAITLPRKFSSNYSLSDLTGSNGFILNGTTEVNTNSISVSSAGDVNGDGIADIIIGTPYANTNAGQSYVVFGNRDSWNNTVSLSLLDGSNGFILNGINGGNPGDQSGSSVSSAGDINGDGIDDLIIGAIGANNNAGQSYVVFGSRDSWSQTFNLSSLDGANGFILNGANAYDYCGTSVASAGDINGDGIEDVIIGAPGIYNNPGQSYVIFGSRNSWNATINLVTLNGINGFILNGINPGDSSGSSVSSAGDINSDGIADIIIGAPNVNNIAGQSYVVFGHLNPWNATINLGMLNGTSGFMLNGINFGDYSGYSVASAGDINGDGISDIIIGTMDGGANNAGQSYVVFGNRNGWVATLNLSSLDGINGFILNGAGSSVASAGDFNGDNITDIIVGEPYDNNAGQSYVLFGHRDVWNATINLSFFNGSNGFVLNGINGGNPGDQSGSSVSSAGDINGDGISDIITSAPYANNKAGQAYVVFGSYSFLQLAVNRLTIGTGQALSLSSNELSIRSFTYSSDSVRFLVNDLRHGCFELAGTNACGISKGNQSSLIEFTQMQVDTGEVIFVHDGTPNAPSYSISFFSTIGLLPVSTPEPAQINFMNYLFIENSRFIANQYQHQIELSSLNILAKNNLNDNQKQIIFTVNSLQNGWFANVNNSNTLLHTFTQAEVNQGQICFYSPCGVNDLTILPSFTLTATAPGGLTTAPVAGVVSYNPAPILTQNAIAIDVRQTVLIGTENIAAWDVNSSSVNNTAWYDPNIVFTVSATGGYFQFVNGASNIATFTQANISNNIVEFVSDATVAPSYNITATDTQGATSLPKAGQVTFQQSSSSSTNSAVTSTIAASVAIGGVAAAGLGLFLLNRRNNKQLHSYIEQASDKDSSLNKIAEVIFGKIKLTGFLNHIQKNRVTEYVNAIKEILEALTAMGFPMDLATMTEKSRNHFLKEFPRQIKAAFPEAEQSRMQFFKPEITPRQIKSQANHIAMSIKNVMDQVESQILDDDLLDDINDIPLTEVSSHSDDRSKGLQEFLIRDENDAYQGQKASKCFVM